MNPELRRILLEACVILILGMVVGLSFNYRLVLDVFSGRLVAPAPQSADQPSERYPVPVDLRGLQQQLGQGAILVDARAFDIYAEGHLQGARSLPLGEFAERLAEFRAAVPLESTLILYCSGYGCPDSFDLGMLLLKEGYQDVQVFEGGFPEWRDAGLPVEKEAP
jgi:rhodanese-related sulfurtransferase